MAAQIAAAVPQSVVAQRQSNAPCTFQLVVSNLHEEIPGPADRSNKWTLWVALHDVANEDVAAIIGKVVYELPHTCRQRHVTAYPPFFSMCRHGGTSFTVRCRVYWNSVLDMLPSEVDHPLVFENGGNRTLSSIDVDRVSMAALQLEKVQSVANKGGELQLSKRKTFRAVGLDERAFSALGLEPTKGANVGNSAVTLQTFLKPSNLRPEGDRSLLEVVVGNRTKGLVQKDAAVMYHQWVMYVNLPHFQMSQSMMIDHVVYTWHPTEGKDTGIGRFPNFEVPCLGWETCEVSCTIHWTPLLGLQPKTVVHEPVFNGLGGRTSATIKVNARRLQCFAQ